MVVLPSNGHRHPHGIKREHDADSDHVYDVSPRTTNRNGNSSEKHKHQHKKKKSHHHQNQGQDQKQNKHQNGHQNGEGEKKKKKKKLKHNSHQAQQEEDTLMSGGLGDMSAELGEPILPPPRNSQKTPTMPKAMKEKLDNGNETGKVNGSKKENKSNGHKSVHFEGNGQVKMNGHSAQRATSTLPVRAHVPKPPQTQTTSPIVPPPLKRRYSVNYQAPAPTLSQVSSPILPPTRPRGLSVNHQTPILPPVSPSRATLLRVNPQNSTPILPPTSPFRRRRGSTGNAFSEPPPVFSTGAPRSQATQPKPEISPDPKPKDDDWEFSTGKIRAMIGNPMEKDAQREESKFAVPIFKNINAC